MFTPSYQIMFHDPVTNLEMPIYNSYILSLFVLILSSLFSVLACSNPMQSDSMIDLQAVFAESSIFISTCMTVFVLCIPSLVVLYSQSPDASASYNLPVTAFQWYWNMSSEGQETELYMEQADSISKSLPYLLETSDCSVIPYGLNTTFFVTSNDVLHSFSIPSAFVKCDAVPSRLNAMTVFMTHPSIFFGQCSELCSVSHSYMPIKLEVVNMGYAK